MTTREFHFSEGASHKFWRITVDGVTQTVQYGRIGTAGQETTKTFDSDTAAKAASDKLIAEKVKKGYAEVGVSGTAASIPAVALASVLSHQSSAPAQAKAMPSPMETEHSPAIGSCPSPSGRGWEGELALAPHEWFWATWRDIEPLPPLEERKTKKKIPSFADMGRKASPEQILSMVQDLGAVGLVELILEYEAKRQSGPGARWDRNWSALTDGVLQGVRLHVRPYLTTDELAACQAIVGAALTKATWPADMYSIPPAAFFLASVLGMSDLLEPVIAAIADKTYTGEDWLTHYHAPQQLVFGLGSVEAVKREMQRLKLRLETPDHIVAWLAHTELADLDFIVRSIQAVGTKPDAEAMVATFARVQSPAAAPYMLELTKESKAPQVARAWLDRHPELAIRGLVPVTVGRPRLTDAAIEYLRRQKKQGRVQLIVDALEGQPASVADRVREMVLDHAEKEYAPLDEASTPAWLSDALKTVTPGKKQALDLSIFPPVVVDGRKLGDSQLALLLDALAARPLEDPGPLLTALKANADTSSLEAFAWTLFEEWLVDGAPSKEKWRMTAIGHLGSDSTALKLAPLVKKWPGESQHNRAVTGLECLRAIGTDTALMQINGIANKVPFKAIKQRAAECMDDIAKARGMTRAELEDRIIPDCDLDDRGSRTFDFGPRQFRLVLSPEMKAMVKDSAGKTLPDLPKPNAKDDPELAAAATAEWKLLKKQVAEVAKVQAARLEQAMVTGRRWTSAEFERLFVRHPLMTNLTRLLLWGIYDGARLTNTFRVTEDQSLAGSDDSPFTLPPDASIGVVHPLQLSDADRSAWSEIWSDYEILPPFPQLGRATFTLAENERDAVELTRFKSAEIPCAAVVFTLDKLGWNRAQPADGGGFSEHTKPFYGANVTAVTQYEPGCAVGYIVEADDQSIDAVFFIPGIVDPGEWWPEHKVRLKWSDIDPVVVSEVLADLTAIVAKGGG